MFDLLKRILDRVTFPEYCLHGHGGCRACKRRWCKVEPHYTDYGHNGHGMFPLCEGCWQSMTIPERKPYYHQLINWWVSEGWYATDEADVTRREVIEAVEAGR